MAISVPCPGQTQVIPRPVPPTLDNIPLAVSAPDATIVLPEEVASPIVVIPQNTPVIPQVAPVIPKAIPIIAQPAPIVPQQIVDTIPLELETVGPVANVVGAAAPGLAGVASLVFDGNQPAQIARPLIPRATIAPLITDDGDVRIAMQKDTPRKANQVETVPSPSSKNANANANSDEEKKEAKPAVRKVRGLSLIHI